MGDTTTSIETLIEAAQQVEAVRPDGEGIEEVVGDKGYHSNRSLVDVEAVGVRSYISEPDRGQRNWKKNPEARAAVYRNHRRIRGAVASACCGSAGRAWNAPLRLLVHTAGFNLGLLMRHLIGVGTPRGVRGRLLAALSAVILLIRALWRPVTNHWPSRRLSSTRDRLSIVQEDLAHIGVWRMGFTTGC